MAGTNPMATWNLPLNHLQDSTTYKGYLDAAAAIAQRIVANFAPSQLSTAAMKVALEPGHIFTGGGLTEIGAYVIGTLNSSTSVTVADATGISNGMQVTGTGIPNGTTCTIIGTTVTLSNAATITGTSALTFKQVSASITAPVSNSRIDRVVIDSASGVMSIVTGTASITPAAPAIPSGKTPVARILIVPSSVVITNSMITDERDFTQAGGSGAQASITAAGTTDLGSEDSTNILINGSTTITAFGSSASTGNPIYTVTFSGSPIITYNATSLIIPGQKSITAQPNDSMTLQYLGGGDWQVIDYQRTNGQGISMTGGTIAVASGSTADLGAPVSGIVSNCINITGTTTITSLGSSASLANPIYFVTFAAALVLTYDATALLLPGATSITTAAGDSAVFKYLGSGNWQCISYNYFSGTSGHGHAEWVAAQTVTFTTPAGTNANTLFKITGTAPGGAGGGAQGGGSPDGGAGGSAGSTFEYFATGLATGTTIGIVIGAIGTGNSNATGNNGGTTTVTIGATTLTAPGGIGGIAGASPNVSGAAGPGNCTGGVHRNYPGGGGGAPNASSSTALNSGIGGASKHGGGAHSVGAANAGAGANADCPGAGGSGACSATAAGGNGGPGIVTIEW